MNNMKLVGILLSAIIVGSMNTLSGEVQAAAKDNYQTLKCQAPKQVRKQNQDYIIQPHNLTYTQTVRANSDQLLARYGLTAVRPAVKASAQFQLQERIDDQWQDVRGEVFEEQLDGGGMRGDYMFSNLIPNHEYRVQITNLGNDDIKVEWGF